jgi:hypothetical protein
MTTTSSSEDEEQKTAREQAIICLSNRATEGRRIKRWRFM